MTDSRTEFPSIGERLRQAREEQGLSLQDVFECTRIRRETLQALEEGRFGDFPDPVYARAFLRDYALFLNLDEGPLLQLLSPVGRPSVEARPDDRALRAPRRGRAIGLLSVFFGLVLVGLAVTRFPQATHLIQGVREAHRPAASPEQKSEPATAPAEDAEPKGVRLRLIAESRVWVRVTSGGRDLFEGTMEAGDTHQFASGSSLSVRAGDGGAVWVSVNGAPDQRLGLSGTVQERVFEPGGSGAAADHSDVGLTGDSGGN